MAPPGSCFLQPFWVSWSRPPALPPSGMLDHCWCPISPSDMREHRPQHGDRLSEASMLPQPFHLLACSIPGHPPPRNEGPSVPPASLNCAQGFWCSYLHSPLESLEGASGAFSYLPNCPAHGRCPLTNVNSFLYKFNHDSMTSVPEAYAASHGFVTCDRPLLAISLAQGTSGET